MAAMAASTLVAGRAVGVGHAKAASSGRCSAPSRSLQQILRVRTDAYRGFTSSAALSHAQRRRRFHFCAADKAAVEVDVAEETAEEATSADTSEEQTAGDGSQTSEDSPFAELMQRARDAFASGEQAEQDAVLQEVDTQLAMSAANAQAADTQLQTVQAELKAQQDKYLRLNAEFDNFRKRSNAEKSNAVNGAKGKVIEELLPVIDAFEAAAQQVKAETEGEQKIMASYQGLYAKMVDAFKKMGLEVVPGVGAPFDPEVHEAIMRAPSDEVPDGTVLQEFRRGFQINGQLLRPGMVQVSYSDEAVEAKADTVAAKAEVEPTPDDMSEGMSGE